MKYTFLLPAYKTKYLQQAIDSILEQSYTNFNVIVSDDCSPESIKTILYSYNDGRIIYRCNNTNIGGERLVDHWNLLVNLCESDYLIMASDDDIYNKDFLKEIDCLACKYPEVDVLRTRVQRINSNNEVTSREDIFEEYQTEIEALHSVFCGNYIGCIGNYVFKTSALKHIGGFVDLPYAWFSDMLTAVAMSKNGQANTNQVLFNFRLSDANISNTTKNKPMELKKLQATIDFDKWMSNYVESMHHDESELSSAQHRDIITSYKHRAYSQCGDYSWALPVYKWAKIYKALKQNKGFSRNSFLKYFGISVINRVLG